MSYVLWFYIYAFYTVTSPQRYVHMYIYRHYIIFVCFNLSHSIHLCVFYFVRCLSFWCFVFCAVVLVRFGSILLAASYLLLFFGLLFLMVRCFHWCGKQYIWYGRMLDFCAVWSTVAKSERNSHNLNGDCDVGRLRNPSETKTFSNESSPSWRWRQWQHKFYSNLFFSFSLARSLDADKNQQLFLQLHHHHHWRPSSYCYIFFSRSSHSTAVCSRVLIKIVLFWFYCIYLRVHLNNSFYCLLLSRISFESNWP